jgi:hypothetical protein
MKVEQGALGVAAPLVEWRIETSILFAALDYLSAGDADVLVLAGCCRAPLPGNAVVGAYLSKLGFDDDAIWYFTASDPANVTWMSDQTAMFYQVSYVKLDDTWVPR